MPGRSKSAERLADPSCKSQKGPRSLFAVPGLWCQLGDQEGPKRLFVINRTVSIDDRRTWPKPVSREVRSVAEQLHGTTQYECDLDIPPDEDDAFRATLRGHFFRAYHATRLLDHEVESIRGSGLRILSEELVVQRVGAALDHNAITKKEQAALRSANVFAERKQAHREGQICLALSSQQFLNASGFCSLLSYWGGEAISKSSAIKRLPEPVRRIGKPAIVVAAIDLSFPWRVHRVDPGVLHTFVATFLRLQNIGADVFYRTSVPPEQIVDIWQPGHPSYDRYAGLPKS